MARPKKNPEDLKLLVSISLTRKEVEQLDVNIEELRAELVQEYELLPDQIKAFNAAFNRSNIIREFIGSLSTKTGKTTLKAGFMAGFAALGIKEKKDTETRSFLDE